MTRSREPKVLQCAICGADFTTAATNRKFCDTCRKAAYVRYKTLYSVERRGFPKPLHPITYKVRVCLRCGKDFMSEGSSNRICPRCAALGTTDPDDPYRMAAERKQTATATETEKYDDEIP